MTRALDGIRVLDLSAPLGKATGRVLGYRVDEISEIASTGALT